MNSGSGRVGHLWKMFDTVIVGTRKRSVPEQKRSRKNTEVYATVEQKNIKKL